VLLWLILLKIIKLYIDNYHLHYLLLTVYIIYCVSTLYIIDCIYRLLCLYICSALRLRRKIKYLSIICTNKHEIKCPTNKNGITLFHKKTIIQNRTEQNRTYIYLNLSINSLSFIILTIKQHTWKQWQCHKVIIINKILVYKLDYNYDDTQHFNML